MVGPKLLEQVLLMSSKSLVGIKTPKGEPGSHLHPDKG